MPKTSKNSRNPNESRQVPVQRHRRTLNSRVLIVSLIFVATAGGIGYGWHYYQARRTATALLDRATQLEVEGKLPAAAITLEQYLLLRRDDNSARVKYAELRSKLSDTGRSRAGAIRLLHEAVRLAPDRSDLRMALAEHLYQTGDYASALEEVDRMPDSQELEIRATAHTIKAKCLYAQLERGNTTLASSCGVEMQAARKLRPKDVPFATMMASFYREFGDLLSLENQSPTEVADQVMSDVVTANEMNADSLLSLYAYQLTYVPQLAEATLTELLDRDPTNPRALIAKVVQLWNRPGERDWESIEKFLNQAIKSAPEIPEGYIILGRYYLERRDAKKAIDVLVQGQKLQPGLHPDILVVLADAYLSDNNLTELERIIADLDKLITDRSPLWSEETKNILSSQMRIAKAKLNMARKEWNAAKSQLQQVLTTFASLEQGGNGANILEVTYRLLGTISASRGRWDEAARSWVQAWDVDRSDKQLIRLAADAFAQAGAIDDAIKYYEQYLETAAETEIPDLYISVLRMRMEQQRRVPPPRRNWVEIEIALPKAKTLAPDDARVAFIEADLEGLRANSSGPKIKEMLSAIEDRFGNNPDILSDLTLRYAAIGDREYAQRAFERFSEIESSSFRKLQLQVDMYTQLRDIPQAMEILDTNVGGMTDDEQRTAAQTKFQLVCRGTDYAAIMEQLAKLGSVSSLTEQSLILACDAAVLAEKWSDVERFEGALKNIQGPDGAEWRLYRAYRLLAQPDEANRLEGRNLAAALRVERPQWYPSAALAGHAALVGERTDDAIREYEMAIALGDRRASTVGNLVSLHSAQGNFAAAADYAAFAADESAATNLRNAFLAISLAVQQARTDDAQKLASDALSASPDDVGLACWIGLTFCQHGMYEQGQKILNDVIERKPNDPQIWMAMVSSFLDRGELDETKNTLDRLEKNDQMPLDARNEILGNAYARLGDSAKAEAFFESALTHSPKNTRVRLAYAQHLLRTNLAKAKEQFSAVLVEDPDNSAAKIGLALVVTASSAEPDWKQIETLLESAADDHTAPQNARIRAILLANRGDNKQARLENCRNAIELLQAQANSEGSLTDTDRALLANLFERVGILAKDPVALDRAREELANLAARHETEITYQLGIINYLVRWLESSDSDLIKHPEWENIRQSFAVQASARVNDFDLASVPLEHLPAVAAVCIRVRRVSEPGIDIETFAQSLATDRYVTLTSENDKSQFELMFGRTFSSVGLHRVADSWYERAVKRDPTKYVFLVQSFVDQGRVADAVSLCLRARSVPSVKNVPLTLARLIAAASVSDADYGRAKPIIDEALSSDTNNLDLLMATATMLASRGDVVASEKLFRDILRLSPDNSLAINNLATLLSERDSGRAEALRLIETAIERSGRVPALLDTLGTIHLLSDNAEAAAQCLEEAVLKGGRDPRTYFHLALALHRASRNAESHTAFQSAKDLGLDGEILTQQDKIMRMELETALGNTDL